MVTCAILACKNCTRNHSLCNTITIVTVAQQHPVLAEICLSLFRLPQDLPVSCAVETIASQRANLSFQPIIAECDIMIHRSQFSNWSRLDLISNIAKRHNNKHTKMCSVFGRKRQKCRNSFLGETLYIISTIVTRTVSVRPYTILGTLQKQFWLQQSNRITWLVWA